MIVSASVCLADLAGRLPLSAINLQQRQRQRQQQQQQQQPQQQQQTGRQGPTLGNSPLILAYSGAIILHGPHHFAVKSSTDTLSAFTQTT